uniref:Uncharacterized protein n=1 Tax=Anguilla anguilla TaxID=7936 RepID=A0A0E9XBZ6_ANGAN
MCERNADGITLCIPRTNSTSFLVI